MINCPVFLLKPPHFCHLKPLTSAGSRHSVLGAVALASGDWETHPCYNFQDGTCFNLCPNNQKIHENILFGLIRNNLEFFKKKNYVGPSLRTVPGPLALWRHRRAWSRPGSASFGRCRTGTWSCPASGPTLLRTCKGWRWILSSGRNLEGMEGRGLGKKDNHDS